MQNIVYNIGLKSIKFVYMFLFFLIINLILKDINISIGGAIILSIGVMLYDIIDYVTKNVLHIGSISTKVIETKHQEIEN